MSNANTVLKNVIFMYTKIQTPVPNYNKDGKEYTVDCVISKEEAKKWDKKFPKQKTKRLDAEEFKSQFKVDPPEDQDDFYVIKLKKKATTKDGDNINPKYRPKVFYKVGKVLKDITDDMLVGNGSVGHVEYREKTHDKYGTFAELSSILVTDLVEYEGSGGVGSAFADEGEFEDDDEETTSKSFKDDEDEEDPPKPAKKAKKPAPKKEEEDSDDSDDDEIPF